MNEQEYNERLRWVCPHRHNGLVHPSCYMKAHPKTQRTGYIDIESSSLQGDFGVVYCWNIKERGRDFFDSYILTEKDYQKGVQRDLECIKQLVMAIQKYDIIVSFYGADYQFDVPFLRTRSLKYGLQFPVYGQIIHLDLYQKVKAKLKLHSNRLESVAELLNIKPEKTRIAPDYWNRASMGYDKEALDYIQEHNKIDTIILEKVHDVIEPYFAMTRRSL